MYDRIILTGASHFEESWIFAFRHRKAKLFACEHRIGRIRVVYNAIKLPCIYTAATMDLDNLLNPIQQVQLCQELVRVIVQGFGHLEVRVEKNQVRWLRPGRAIFNPLAARAFEPPQGVPSLRSTGGLAEILGAWLEPLAGELGTVMGYGFGTILLSVEHGRIRSIVSTTDVRARTGKTDEIKPLPDSSTTALHP